MFGYDGVVETTLMLLLSFVAVVSYVCVCVCVVPYRFVWFVDGLVNRFTKMGLVGLV